MSAGGSLAEGHHAVNAAAFTFGTAELLMDKLSGADADAVLAGDTSHALDFLKHWAPGGPWALTAIEPDTGKIETRTFQPDKEVQAATWLDRHQGRRNIYFSVNRPRRNLASKAKKEDIGWAVALHVDVDPRKGFALETERPRILAALGAHVPQPTVIIDTGGGYSGFWLLREPAPADDPTAVEARNIQLATELGGDHCHNIDRIMRLPGTVNLPDKVKRQRGRVPALASVVEVDWSRRYDLDDFEPAPVQKQSNGSGLGTAPAVVPNGHDPADLTALPETLRDLIISGDAARWEGDRSKAVWHVCCGLVRAGWNDDQIAALLLNRVHGISAHVLDQDNPTRCAQRQARRAREEVAKEPLVLSPDDPRAAARAFTARRVRRLICHAGDMYEWRESHYSKLDEGDVRADLYDFLETAQRYSNKKLVPFAPTRAKVDNVLDALMALVHLPSQLAPPCWIEGDAMAGPIMACRNGLLRLSDGLLLPHSSAYFNTAAADFDYDPAADAPEWLKFLGSVWPDDTQAVDTIQEMIGYILSGDNRHQKMFMLIGPRRCGKGTIGRVLIKLLGGRGHVGLPLGNLNGDFGLQPLLGKMLVMVPDARLHGRSHTIVERLLAISGGDDLTVARKNTLSVTTRLPARFVFLTNVLPALADPSGTIASRFIVLMLTVSFFGREDLNLEQRLTGELPGILNWALAGWRRLNERGRFVQPASGVENASNLAYLASPMTQFVEENYEVGVKDEERTDDVYNAWCAWWLATGQSGESGSTTSFGIKLAAAFPQVKREERRKMTNAKPLKWHVYVGLRRRGRDGQAELLNAGEYEADEVPF